MTDKEGQAASGRATLPDDAELDRHLLLEILNDRILFLHFMHLTVDHRLPKVAQCGRVDWNIHDIASLGEWRATFDASNASTISLG